MTELNEVFKCEPCGNMVEIVHTGKGTLVCCGQPMQRLEEMIEDAGYEKHVPVREGDRVRVGSAEHPMLEQHYIEWIELIGERTVARRFLRPGDRPQAEFPGAGPATARAYCNSHGLWRG